MSKGTRVWVACIGDAANIASFRYSRKLVAEWCSTLPQQVAKLVIIRRATLILDPVKPRKPKRRKA